MDLGLLRRIGLLSVRGQMCIADSRLETSYFKVTCAVCFTLCYDFWISGRSPFFAMRVM